MNERHIKLCASMLHHALFADHTQDRRASEVKSALQFFFTDAEIECARADVSGKPRPTQETPVVPPYPNTGHGHVWPRPDGMRARCGGPGICTECSRDQAQFNAAQAREKL